MLNNLSKETVEDVAILARQAVAARDRFINRAYAIDLGEQPRERGSRNPTDLDSLSVLNGAGSGQELKVLQERINSLSPDERLELKALMLIGRGDFTAKEWEMALADAMAVPESGDTDYLSEKLSLHDYLAKGLYELHLR